MPAVTATGVLKFACCQPRLVSLVKVTCASRSPVASTGCRRACPCWTPLVEANTGDVAADDRRELHAQLDRVGVIRRRDRGVVDDGQIVHGHAIADEAVLKLQLYGLLIPLSFVPVAAVTVAV